MPKYRTIERPRTWALLPAYNEAEIIERTIDSLMNQTVPFDKVVVIANNCTDNTAELAYLKQIEYGFDKIELIIMENNAGKKAGALNYGYRIIPNGVDLVFGMDGDTVIDSKMHEEAIKKFAREPRTGGICSAYRAMPMSSLKGHKPDGSLTWWQRLLWRLQNLEFGLANAWRVEHLYSARVLPGVSSMYRKEMLDEIAALNGGGQVWVEGDLVEDYTLTLQAKDLGWHVKSYHDMVSWSDVPLNLSELWRQRTRWASGTVDTVRHRGWVRKHSRYEAFTILILPVSFVLRAVLLTYYGVLIATGGVSDLWTWFLFIPVLVIGCNLIRLLYASQLDYWQVGFVVTLVVYEAYNVFREAIYMTAIFQSYFRPNRGW